MSTSFPLRFEQWKRTRSLRSTAIESKWPSWASASGDSCQLSQSLSIRVMGTRKGRPRARHILSSILVRIFTDYAVGTHPLSRTKSDIQHLSLPRRSRMPLSDAGSTSGNPSIARAVRGSKHSPRATDMPEFGPRISGDIKTLWSDRSMAIVLAIETYAAVSSFVLCVPGNIHGTLMRKASTISTDLYRQGITLWARVFA